MVIKLAIDDKLIEEAQLLGGQKTKKAAVTEALEEYVQRRRQQAIVKLFGRIDYDAGHDYKKRRRRG
ncbi:MAG: type II toxin-antitoxin system VapB family antitoxin [Thermodesulfobacteriota bacterium]